MSDVETGATPPADRAGWIRELRRRDEDQEDALVAVDDPRWGEIEDTHRAFVERFLSMLPHRGGVLDAACGVGTYFPVVLASGRSLLGVDHSGASLATAAGKVPDVPTAKHDLQDLPYIEEFDGVMCVDAMEFVPPEDWPKILERFRRALRPGGWLYLTIELAPEDQVRALNEEARRSGLPVVDGEVFWDEPDGYYHHHPTMQRVRAWITDAGFEIEEEEEGPWHEEGYAYHHVLARSRDSPASSRDSQR
jgi:SAM-dependent methyltransferase